VKPCGGPWEYLVFSTEVTEQKTLEDLVRRYDELNRSLNEALGSASNCAMVQAPELVLNVDRCEAKSNDQSFD